MKEAAEILNSEIGDQLSAMSVSYLTDSQKRTIVAGLKPALKRAFEDAFISEV